MHFTKKMIHPNGHMVDIGDTSPEALKATLARKIGQGFRPTGEPIVDHASELEAERQAENRAQTEVLPPPPVPESTSVSQPVEPVEANPKKSRGKK